MSTLPQAAEWPAAPEVHHHLHYRPFIALGIVFDPAPLLREALALQQEFVAHREAVPAGGWRSLALRAEGGDHRRTQTGGTPEPFAPTAIALRCPATMDFLREITDLDQCGRVRFMLLEPGATIPLHADSADRLYPAGVAINVSLNMPAGCEFVADTRPDGTPTPFTVRVPFADSGSVLLFNSSKPHTVFNQGQVPRVHILVHGPVRREAASILADARRQNGLASDVDVLRAIAWKRAVLGEFTIDESEDIRQEAARLGPLTACWPESVRIAVLDCVRDPSRGRESAYKITAASLYPLPLEVCRTEDLDAWIGRQADSGASHAVVVGAGTFVPDSAALVWPALAAIATMQRGATPVAGHLLDRLRGHGDLPCLHEQFAILDLARWGSCGKPGFGSLHGQDVGRFPRYHASAEQVHDDYTPLRISAAPGGEAVTGRRGWGTGVIAAALEHGLDAINLGADLRAVKRHGYPDLAGEGQYEEVLDRVASVRRHAATWVYCFNTEPLAGPEIPGFRPRRVICVAAGFKWLALLRQYASDAGPPELCLADCNPAGLEYVRAVLAAQDRDGVVDAVVRAVRCNPSSGQPETRAGEALDAVVASLFEGGWPELLDFKASIGEVRSRAADFVGAGEALVDWFDVDHPTLFWHSNAWCSHGALYAWYPEELEDRYARLLGQVRDKLGLSAFRLQGQRLAIFGRTLDEPHSVFTDGDAGAFPARAVDWLPVRRDA